MHAHSVDDFRHSHVFLGEGHEQNERRTRAVILVCAAMMLAEIVGGSWFGSVALVADGLHMATHAGALFIAVLAYSSSRRYANDSRLTFGTGKFGDLAAFSSAIILAIIALFIGYESLDRLFHPMPIAFREAIPIAVLGLGVNVLSAFLLGGDHHHDHDHRENHGHVHQDNNLRAAFVHVVADAAVSVFVIVGLVAGLLFGWTWTDPLMGLVVTAVILSWSWTLMRSAGAVLLDVCPDPELASRITMLLEQGSDRISDLHLWRLGPGHLAAVVSIVTHDPRPAERYKRRLRGLRSLSHVTIEVVQCPTEAH
jgi:cation diffusion facilitator family transporter